MVSAARRGLSGAEYTIRNDSGNAGAVKMGCIQRIYIPLELDRRSNAKEEDIIEDMDKGLCWRMHDQGQLEYIFGEQSS